MTKNKKVPYIITGKDLLYLEDAFKWNYTAYKNILNVDNKINNKELKNLLDESKTLFIDNIKTINLILKEKSNED